LSAATLHSPFLSQTNRRLRICERPPLPVRP
jgi:hypothetical protein